MTTYFSDKEYDLATFVPTETPPKDAYFLILSYVETDIIAADMTNHIPSYCYTHLDRFLNHHKRFPIFMKAYWIPDRKLNEIIYYKTFITDKTTIHVTVQPRLDVLPKKSNKYNDVKNVWTTLKILHKTQCNINEWYKRPYDKLCTIEYFVPCNE